MQLEVQVGKLLHASRIFHRLYEPFFACKGPHVPYLVNHLAKKVTLLRACVHVPGSSMLA